MSLKYYDDLPMSQLSYEIGHTIHAISSAIESLVELNSTAVGHSLVQSDLSELTRCHLKLSQILMDIQKQGT